jgi:serine/threonine-protein kinase
MTQDDSIPVAIGELIAGKYRVERVLGRGGMGVVVSAMHTELEQRVALKFLLPQAMEHPPVVARFAREAKAAAKIKSEHVARVIDVGALPTGAPYVVMEFMEGEDLAVVVSRRGPFSIEVAVGYVLEACEAIAEAHSHGIVHRDIKPANLFLAKQPNGRSIIKVLDFGISKSTLSTTQANLTQTSTVMGSPLYMSPEQMISSKSVDVRSDIWALGIVLYEFLTASVPFQSDTLPELIAAVLQREAEPLRTVRPDAPPALEAIVTRCLAKEPSVRFANVAELAAALAPFGPPRSAVSVERITSVLGLAGPPPASDAGPPLVTNTAATFGRTGSPRASTMPHTPLPVPTGNVSSSFATGATTTSKPLSTTSPPTPAGLPGPKGIWVVAIAGLSVAMMATLGTIGWRWAAARTPATVASAAVPSATTPDPDAPAVPPPPAPSASQAAASASAGDTTGAPASATASAAAPSTPDNTPSNTASPRTGGRTAPAEPPATAARPATDRPHAAPAGTNCTLVKDFDTEGNPHFRKVCK